jgi:hypothetical protein
MQSLLVVHLFDEMPDTFSGFEAVLIFAQIDLHGRSSIAMRRMPVVGSPAWCRTSDKAVLCEEIEIAWETDVAPLLILSCADFTTMAFHPFADSLLVVSVQLRVEEGLDFYKPYQLDLRRGG